MFVLRRSICQDSRSYFSNICNHTQPDFVKRECTHPLFVFLGGGVANIDRASNKEGAGGVCNRASLRSCLLSKGRRFSLHAGRYWLT